MGQFTQQSKVRKRLIFMFRKRPLWHSPEIVSDTCIETLEGIFRWGLGSRQASGDDDGFCLLCISIFFTSAYLNRLNKCINFIKFNMIKNEFHNHADS